MKNETVEMIEEFNKDGVCIKRTVNGYELPADTEPSIQIFKECSYLTQKFFLTPEEAKERFNYHPPLPKKSSG